MRLIKTASVLLVATQIASCGMANNLTKETYDGINTVSINKQVAMTGAPRVHGAGENAAFALGGIIGAVAAGDSNMSKGQMLAKAMEKFKIDLRSKVYAGFNRKLKQNSMFSGKLVDSASDATFDLEITLYGLYASGPFSSKMEPEVQIRATLKRADGQQLWTNFGYVTAMNFSGYEYTMDEYMKDPAKLDRAYDAAIDKALKNLIGSLKLAMLQNNLLLAQVKQ